MAKRTQVKSDWLADYYNEMLSDTMVQTNRRHVKLLLDYLLENGFLVDRIIMLISGWQPDGTTMLVEGWCYDENAVVYKFRARYVQNPRWQVPEELPSVIESVEIMS